MNYKSILIFLLAFWAYFNIQAQETNVESKSIPSKSKLDLSLGINTSLSPSFRFEFEKKGSNARSNLFLQLENRRSFSSRVIKEDSTSLFPNYCATDRFLTADVSYFTVGLVFYPDGKDIAKNGLGGSIGISYAYQHFDHYDDRRPLTLYLVSSVNYKYFVFKQLYLSASTQLYFGFSYLKDDKPNDGFLYIPDFDLELLTFRVGYLL